MSSELVSLSRAQLYEQVWTEPVRILAKRYGVSDVGLAKQCRRLSIPLPARGYWAKKAAGHRVKQTPLPPLPPNSALSPEKVVIGSSAPKEPPPPLPGPVAEQRAYENDPTNRIVVADALRSPHPLVRQTLDALKGSARTETAYVGNWQVTHLDVDVSRDMLPRALRIMDAMVKAFERRGWKVSIGTGERDRKSYVTILGVRVPFGIREKIKKLKNEPPKPVRTSSGSWYTPYEPKYRDEPSGTLAFVLRSRSEGMYGVEQSFDETASRPAEARLNDFMVAVVARAFEDREWDRRRMEEEQRRFEEAERRREEARRREIGAARGKELERQADDLSKCRTILALVSAVRERAQSAGADLSSGSPLDAWIDWAIRYAARLDPVSALLEKLVTPGGMPDHSP